MVRPYHFMIPKTDQSIQLQVNFSPMLTKLLLTYPDSEEDRGIAIFEIDFVKSLTQSIRTLCQLDFFTKSLTILFVLIYSELSWEHCESSRKEVTSILCLFFAYHFLILCLFFDNFHYKYLQ